MTSAGSWEVPPWMSRSPLGEESPVRMGWHRSLDIAADLNAPPGFRYNCPVGP